MIAQGAHATVTLADDGRVRKRLHASTHDARTRLEREFRYLERLADAVAGQPYLACPIPLAIETDERTLVMTHCPGTPLDTLITDLDVGFDAHVQHLVDQIALAIAIYVEAFSEPYYSLSAANLVFDVATRRLYLLDFTAGRSFPGIDEGAAAVEVSVGCLLARSVHHTVGPRSVWRRHLLDRYTRLLAGVLQQVPQDLDAGIVLDIALQTRRSLTGRTAIDTLHGPAWHLRQAWHRGPGDALFRLRARSIVGRPRPQRTAPPT